MPVVHAGGYGLSNAKYRDIAVRQQWANPEGDWIDANGIVHGPAPTIQASGSTATLDISSIPAELVIQGINAVSSITIDGQPADAYWTAAGSGGGFRLPSSAGHPVIVMNVGGKSMTVTGNAKGTWRVDPLYLLPVPDYPVAGTRTDPDILSVACSSEAVMFAATKGAAQPSPFIPGAHEFGSFNGMNYLRCCSDAAGDGRVLGAVYPFGPVDEAYCGYALYIEDDVWDAVNDLGIKLSGFSMRGTDPRDAAQAWSEGEQSGYYSGKKQPLNRGVFGLDHYTRDGNTGSGAITETPTARALLVPGRWYWLERRVKMNTPGVADGIEQEWINGNLICDQRRLWRWGADMQIWSFHLQLYHGGVNRWIGPAHYRVAQIELSSKPIGVPNVLRAATPPVVDPPVIVKPPIGNSMDINTVIAAITTALNDAYSVAGQPSIAQQLTDAQTALATANANLATANGTISTLQGQIATIKAKAATLNTADAAENAALADLVANLPA